MVNNYKKEQCVHDVSFVSIVATLQCGLIGLLFISIRSLAKAFAENWMKV